MYAIGELVAQQQMLLYFLPLPGALLLTYVALSPISRLQEVEYWAAAGTSPRRAHGRPLIGASSSYARSWPNCRPPVTLGGACSVCSWIVMGWFFVRPSENARVREGSWSEDVEPADARAGRSHVWSRTLSLFCRKHSNHTSHISTSLPADEAL
jgi:hypothetical protein